MCLINKTKITIKWPASLGKEEKKSPRHKYHNHVI